MTLAAGDPAPVLAAIAGAGIVPTIAVISLLSWPVLARMVRRAAGTALSAISSSLRAAWAPLSAICCGGMALPNSIDILVVYAALQIANAILLEAACPSWASASHRPTPAGATC
jgi:peptide/nickel transport system permease protein